MSALAPTQTKQPATSLPFAPAITVRKTPPLESGDRLTRAEFERRYEAMPHIKKAELIEGVVQMPSPVHVQHSKAHGLIMTLLGTYTARTPFIELHDNVSVRLDRNNEVQPDALLRLDANFGGQSQISSDNYIEGAPELIVEIAASSASYDLYEKKRVYRRNGVQEYVVWRVYDGEIDWFRLDEGEYRLVGADDKGVIRSKVFPGLWLAVQPMLAGDLATVLETLQNGLQTPEHQTFVEGLTSVVGSEID